MVLFIECVILCLFMWGTCYLATGTDDLNIQNFESYPLDVQKKLRENSKFKGKIKKSNKLVIFISNIILFLIVFFICGLFIRTKDFLSNFIKIFALGQILNLFDLIVIDLIWWRNTPRIRFKSIPEKEKYRNPRMHIEAFVRAIFMFTIVAVIDALILTNL